jgi:plastocyanin
MQPVSALQEPITVETDKKVYDISETINISGQVSVYAPNSTITLAITDPTGRLYDIRYLPADSEGIYQYGFRIANTAAINGVYTVQALYDGRLVQTTFQFGLHLDSINVDIEYGSALQNTGKSYSPKEISVIQGATVMWTNQDIVGHTVTSGIPGHSDFGMIFDSASPLLSPRATFKHRFDTAGIYPYFCFVHPWMTGKITVGEASPYTKIAINARTKLATFNAGDNVQITGSIRPIFLQQPLLLEVTDPDGLHYLHENIVVEQDGKFAYEFKLSKYSKGGAYNITISLFDSTKTLTINVDPGLAPPNTEKPGVTPAEKSAPVVKSPEVKIVWSKFSALTNSTSLLFTNDAFRITGMKFVPSANVTVNIYMENKPSPVIQTDLTASSGGSFFTQITFPPQMAPGDYILEAVSVADENITATVPFRVQPISTLVTISKNTLYPGDMLAVNGNGFAAQSPLTISIYGENMSSPLIQRNITTSLGGSFSAKISLPADVAIGSYSLSATNVSSNVTTTLPFRVQAYEYKETLLLGSDDRGSYGLRIRSSPPEPQVNDRVLFQFTFLDSEGTPLKDVKYEFTTLIGDRTAVLQQGNSTDGSGSFTVPFSSTGIFDIQATVTVIGGQETRVIFASMPLSIVPEFPGSAAYAMIGIFGAVVLIRLFTSKNRYRI